MSYRTDSHNNPTAFTTDLARQGGLEEGTDFITGDSFLSSSGKTLFTARLLGDPIQITLKLISKVSFYTQSGLIRWIYIGMPPFVWNFLDPLSRIQVIEFMYHNEGGTKLQPLFDKILRPPVPPAITLGVSDKLPLKGD